MHILIGDRLIVVNTDLAEALPFSWVVCRTLNAALNLAGAYILLNNSKNREQGNKTAFLSMSIGSFLVICLGVVYACLVAESVPQTLFPNAIVPRPYDFIPLVLYALAGVFIYPKLYRRHPNVFSHALLLSTIPNIMVQLHIGIGSTEVFDNHFMIAHFLKVVAYGIPFMGLLIDYMQVYQKMQDLNQTLYQEIDIREKFQQELEAREQEAIVQANDLQNTLTRLHQTQSQLIHTEKMSGLGQMVAGIAHEVNNPINFIHGNLKHTQQYVNDLLGLADLYQDEYPAPNDRISDYIEEIDFDFLRADCPKMLGSMSVGTERIREIVKSLRNFSRVDEAEFKPADLHAGLESTLLIVEHKLKKRGNRPGIKITKDYGKLPQIECAPGQLNQVFTNLIVNAIDALLEDETQIQPCITIRTQLLDQHIQIEIADNGPGIPDFALPKIFDPFFTTKPVGQGTGLGLSISYQIITERHQGELTVQSNLSEGTTFLIRLPIAPVHPSAPKGALINA